MITGRLTITFTDSRTGEQTRSPYSQSNLIHTQTLLDILGSAPNPVFAFLFSTSIKISISTQATAPVAGNNNLTGILATGAVPSGVTSPVWFENINPNVGQIINQFPAPGISRTFDSVGLTYRGTNNNEGSVTGIALTTALLTIPCTQLGTEILTIYYFIELSQLSSSRFSNRFLKDFGGRLLNCKICDIFFLGFSYGEPNQDYNDIYFDTNDRVIDSSSGWNSASRVNSHFKWKQAREFTIANSGVSGQTDQEIGRIFNSALVGFSNFILPNGTSYVGGTHSENVSSCYRMDRYRPQTIAVGAFTPKQPPFQPIWGKRPAYNAPFFEPLFPARGSGGLALAGNWATDFPSMYRVEIVAGGAAGTATYRLRKRWHLGFSGNSWTNRLVGCPYRNPNTAPASGIHGWRNEDNDLLRVSNTTIVQYDVSGVTRLNLLTGEFRNWDASTSPALAANTIRQCAIDIANQICYVACRQTGLWAINLATNAVTQILNTPCYGVDVGFNNVVYAVFNGSLRSSANWAIALSITFSGLTSAWANCLYLKANPESNQAQIAIIIAAGANRQIVWWRGDTQSAVAGNLGTSVGQWAASFEVSDVGGFWADTGGNRHTFGTTTVVGTGGGVITRFLTHPMWGSVNLGKITFWGNLLVCLDRLVDSTGTTVTTYPTLGSSNYFTSLHLVGGILCLGHRLQCIAPSTYGGTWVSYGFSGGAWVAGSTATKTTHAAAEALIDGLTIQFLNGASAPHFVTADEYLTTCCLGTLKDNSVSIYYENYWYTVPVVFDEPIPAGVTIVATYQLPAALNPTFLRIETDSIDSLSSFTINNTPVLKVWIDGTVPAPQEVAVTALGIVTFNAADAGKVFGGTYTWVSS